MHQGESSGGKEFTHGCALSVGQEVKMEIPDNSRVIMTGVGAVGKRPFSELDENHV
jgi:hypothetical protein